MTKRPTYSFEQLREHGLLWLINVTCLHPRGFALGLAYPDDADHDAIMRHEVEPVGWTIFGDGSEPWVFGTKFDDGGIITDPTIVADFEAVEAFLNEWRTVEYARSEDGIEGVWRAEPFVLLDTPEGERT